MKKGFTLVELVFVMAVLGLLAYFAIPTIQQKKEAEETDSLIEKTMVFVGSGIYSTVNGYISGAGADCSPSMATVTGITAAKVVDCAQLTNTMTALDKALGDKSYAQIQTGMGSCKLYTREDTTSSGEEFFVLLDCGALFEDDPSKKAKILFQIEDKFKEALKVNYSGKYILFYDKSKAIDTIETDTTGTVDDGIVGAKLKVL